MSKEALEIFKAMIDESGQASEKVKREIRYTFLYKHVVAEIEYLKQNQDTPERSH